MNQVNQITLTKRSFGNDTLLYAAVAQQLQLLLANGYKCVVFDADPKGGSICIQYALENDLFGQPQPYWLLDVEADQAQDFHNRIEIETAKHTLKELSSQESLDEDIQEIIDKAKIKKGDA